ncbi:hypothetical protein [Desulfosporosinus sp. OT]|uniref:hypothetical protein n=1 Tax=Desulfosporosinus sp. OT TaxID=913865 RepID=UPI000223A3DD|nr:hypothetical protein [Desulfosporosinus sp. OT]EGW41363.1 hypothetical protein DOT_0717 [Desulfosporosinus sp. OT]
MINQYNCIPPMPATPFSFSILVDSPIRRNLKFSPVSAMIFPLASTQIHYASMIIVGLDVLMAFLFKRSLAHPPNPSRPSPDLYPVTLTLPQLTKLMQAAINGQVPMPSPVQTAPGQGIGPVGGDEPLFPDNLSVSLIISAPFAPFDGSPDTSFNVPLFEIPGAPGNLIIALGLIIAQFFIERTGIGTPDGTGNGSGNPDTNGNVTNSNDGKGGVKNATAKSTP